jgi:diaminopimelate epimerase
MRLLKFYKYQGTGSDFVMIDNREDVFDTQDHALITRLCDRKFGIGADGLILLNLHAEYDFEMVYYNADASLSMCGNGTRCAVHLAHHLGIIGKHTTFLAADGTHEASINDEQIYVKMKEVDGIEEVKNGYFLNTGTRHFVSIVEKLSEVDVFNEGRKVRYAAYFQPEGTNANFIEFDNNEVSMRIYEKGVENETLSSGTGVTAVALVAAHVKNLPSPVKVNTRGGELQISFEQTGKGQFSNIYMAGPAVMVFEGTVFV